MRATRMVKSHELAAIIPANMPLGIVDNPQTKAVQFLELDADEPVQSYSSEAQRNNVALKSAVLENEQLLDTTSEVQLEQMETARVTLADRNAMRQATVKAFDDEYRWPTASGINREKLVKLLGLEIEPLVMRGVLRNMKHARVTSPPESVTPQNDTLQLPTASPKDPKLDVDQRSALSGTSTAVSDASLPTELQHAPQRLEGLLNGLLTQQAMDTSAVEKEISRLSSAMYGAQNDLGHAMVQIHEFINTDVLQFIKKKLMSTIGVFEQKAARIPELMKAKEEREKEGDVVGVEKALADIVAAFEDILTVATERANQVMLSSSNEGNFRSSFETFRDQVRATLLEVRRVKAQLKQQAINDIEKLEDDLKEREAQNEHALAEYNAWLVASNAKLDQWAKEQDDKWQQVAKLVQEMGEIGVKRAEEVKIHLAKSEEEYQRKRHFAEYVAVEKRHTDLMHSLQNLNEISLATLEIFDENFERCVSLVENKDMEEGLGEMRQQEQQRFFDYYKPFSHALAELLGRREARLKLSERSRRVMDVQWRRAADMLDPNRERYREMKAELDAAVAATKEGVATMEVKKTYWREVFVPIREALVEIAARTASTEDDEAVKDPDITAEDLYLSILDELLSATTAATQEDNEAVVSEEKALQDEDTTLNEAIKLVEEKRKGTVRRDFRSNSFQRKTRGLTPGARGLTPKASTVTVPKGSSPERQVLLDGSPKTDSVSTTALQHSSLTDSLNLPSAAPPQLEATARVSSGLRDRPPLRSPPQDAVPPAVVQGTPPDVPT